MLRQRVITAIVLVAVFLAANFWLPEVIFLMLITGLCLTGAWEWSRLAKLEQPMHQWLYVTAMLIVIVVVYLVPGRWATGLVVFGAMWWLFRFVLLFTGRLQDSRESLLLSGLWVLAIAWLSLAMLHQHSPLLLLIGLVWVWGADSFAYFTGKRFGKHKLAPRISPGKTIEGVAGGTAGVLILAILSAWILQLPAAKWLPWLVGAALLSLISVGGDLFESWLKRSAGVKDSGALLPGHGGVLDRIDGVVAVMPFYYLLVYWLLA